MREYPLTARLHNRKRPPVPLSGEKIRQFIANGHLVLKSSLPRSYHDLIFERVQTLNHGYGHFGNNLLPLLPELNEFFEDPRCQRRVDEHSRFGISHASAPRAAFKSAWQPGTRIS